MAGLVQCACSGRPFASFDDVPRDSESAAGSDVNAGAAGVMASVGATSSNDEGGKQPGPSVAGSAASGAGGSSAMLEVGAGGAAVESEAGGAAGDGGSNNPGPAPKLEVIDDFEGTFPALPARSGRNGGWYMTHDDSYGHAELERATLLDAGMAGNQHAVHFSGGGFTDWGGQLGASLRSMATSYDATAYCGLRFLAKGPTAQWTLLISDRQSVPQGGVCGAPNAPACYDFVGKTFNIGPAWQVVTLSFDELSSVLEAGSTRKLDAAAIYDILFNFQSASGKSFELRPRPSWWRVRWPAPTTPRAASPRRKGHRSTAAGWAGPFRCRSRARWEADVRRRSPPHARRR